MTKNLSSPPLLILVDLLFLLVFILIINKENYTTIHIPKDILFKGSILVYQKDNFRYIVNQKTGSLGNIFIDKEQNNFSYYEKCNIQCSSYNNLDIEKLYIYFPDKLFSQISKLSYIASSQEYQCKNINYKITDDGKINFQKLLLDNKCLKKIKGINYFK